MHKLIIGLVLLIGITFSLNRYLQLHTFPHTYLSHVNASGKTKSALERSLSEILDKPVRVSIKNRVYMYTYADLGVIFNADKTIRTLFDPNTDSFSGRMVGFMKALRGSSMYIPAFIFTQDYYGFAENTIYDLSQRPDQVVVDNINKKLIYEEHQERYRIDPESLKQQIIFNFGDEDAILNPVLVQIESAEKQNVLGKNTSLANVFDQPVTIILQDADERTRFTLPSDQLKQLIHLSYNPESNNLAISIIPETFTTLLTNIKPHLHLSEDKRIAEQSLKDDLIGLIHTRASDKPADAVIAKAEVIPNSNGSLAAKYIEVDISQQSMYLFQNSQQVKSYRISTGLHYPTPPGQYKILNKATNAFSDIYDVWMPYWMAFHFAKDVNAYLGIHELPYWIASDGQHIQRPRSFIGAPNTGGCVALDVGAAAEVYAFADIDMPVYIYN